RQTSGVAAPEGGYKQGGMAIGVGWPDARRNRPCRRCGNGPRGAIGQQLGVALVEPDDGVAQMVGGEDLGSPTSLRVDLRQIDYLDLVGADVELLAGDPACRHPLAEQGERVAEGHERLVPTLRLFGAQQVTER